MGGALAYIKNLQDKWREAGHPEQFMSNEEKFPSSTVTKLSVT